MCVVNNNNNSLFSENNSEVSSISCLDSNYDSDTSFYNKNSNETGKFDAKLIENFLSRQSTLTNALSSSNHGAEDLHAVTDHLLKEQMKVNELLETSEGSKSINGSETHSVDGSKKELSRSSSPNTPTNNSLNGNAAFSPSTTSLSNMGSRLAEQAEDPVAMTTTDQLKSHGKVLAHNLLRQLSDGYSSSCSPLSASSINNEQPSVNPFFQDASSGILTTMSSSSGLENESADDQSTPPVLKLTTHVHNDKDAKKSQPAVDELLPAPSTVTS